MLAGLTMLGAVARRKKQFEFRALNHSVSGPSCNRVGLDAVLERFSSGHLISTVLFCSFGAEVTRESRSKLTVIICVYAWRIVQIRQGENIRVVR